MFMFSHYTLNAFSPRVFIRYKRHACLMAVLLFICGACCLAWPLVAGWYLATVTGMLLMICGFYSLYSLIVFRQQHWKSRLVALIFAIALAAAMKHFPIRVGWRRLIWPFYLAFYLFSAVFPASLTDVKPANKAALAGIFLSACWIYLSLACGWP